jgi:hypothetical protein
MTNVIRFPVERRARPSLDRLRHMIPDSREVMNVIDAFHLDRPASQTRNIADAMTAETILNDVPPERGAQRTRALDEMLDSWVGRAIAACEASQAAEAAMDAAQARVVNYMTIGAVPEAVETEAEQLSLAYAKTLLEAHLSSEEAEGAARAIGLAKRGETWTPHSADEDMVWLCAFQEARSRG